MAGYVSWRLEMNVAEGRMDELVALMEEMVDSTRNEPGTLIYEWSFTSDGAVGSSRVDLQACKLEYSIVSPK